MKKIRKNIEFLPFVALLLLVIFFDGIIGGLYRAAGKKVLSKIIGWVMIVAFAATVISFAKLPSLIGWIFCIVAIVFWVVDVVTVSTRHGITFLAE